MIPSISTDAVRAAVRKPLMRGWFHAAGAAAAVVGTVLAAAGSGGSPVKLVATLVYGVSLIVLLGFSATYHIPHWSPARSVVMQRIDHANIFVLIAGTYTPICAILLSGWFRLAMLGAVWGIALTGIALSGVLAPHRRITALVYVGMGWVALVAAPEIVAAVGASLVLVLIGGILYSVGAVAYATQRPRLWPRVFGYHEVFHLLVIAASILFYAFIVGAVLPHPLST